MKFKNNTILLVGGGTGGHAAPILAVYNELSKTEPDLNIVACGVGSKEEREFLSQIPEYKIIFSGKLNRFLTLRNIGEVIKILLGFFQSIFLLLKLRPKTIFSKGGFVSLPVIWAARILRIPYFLHESDIIMGKANRLMAKKAKKVFTGFPTEYYTFIPSKKLIFSGPVLRSGFDNKTVAGNLSLFGFRENISTIFLTGGSQGSLNMTKNFLEIVENLLQNHNIIHQAGRHSFQIANYFRNSLSNEQKERYFLTEFLGHDNENDWMLEAIRCSDLIISRASSTIAELAILGKPMVLIPWQYSAQDHQTKNAEFFIKRKAAVMINEKELTPRVLKNKIEELFYSPEIMKNLGLSAAQIFPKNGANIISAELLKNL